MSNYNQTSRFYLLDLARAIAAICVVLQHYQHFYMIPSIGYQENFTRNQQPLYEIIKPLYLFGTVAVQFFFVLSGFIFFFMYMNMILEKKINFKNFIILRLSRLYPLHLLTLFIMLFLQMYYIFLNNEYYIYQNNSWENFILHLFLIQEWGLSNNWGFNAASWSISVEFLLYISFFLIALKGVKNLSQSLFLLLLIFLAYCFIQPKLGNLMGGFLCFYIGGTTFFLYDKLKKIILKNNSVKIALLFLLIFLDILIFGRFTNSFFLEIQNEISFFSGDRVMLLLYFVKFPLIIINLTLMQMYFSNLGKSFKLFGDMSYTIYLIHVPVEIVFSIIDRNIININFDSNLIFLSYFFTIFLISFIIYSFFEIPLKIFIRKKLIKI